MSDHLVNQIAAGEVVEDAASAAKELIENALDAGASRVVVHLEKGGYQLLSVVDDGCGMSADDAVLCFERHATSKIRQADDLVPAERADARWDSPDSDHFNSARLAGLPGVAGRRFRIRAGIVLPRAAATQRPRRGLHHRP